MEYKDFYDDVYRGDEYANRGNESPFRPILEKCIHKYGVSASAKCLEVGSGRGALQDVVEDYTGVDLSNEVAKYYHKTFYSCSATDLPFEDETFDFIWTEAVLEHIPEIDLALEEILRVTKPGGIIFLAPAWYCKRWYAWGGHVKGVKELPAKYKLYKLLIPILSLPAVQFAGMLPQRIKSLLELKKGKITGLRYVKIKANYEEYLGPDSDACNGLDPCQVSVWFEKRGHKDISHPSYKQKLFIRTENIVIKKNCQ